MTVGELKKILEHCPDDMRLITANINKRSFNVAPVYHVSAANVFGGTLDLAFSNDDPTGVFVKLTPETIETLAKPMNEAFADLKAKRS